MTKILDLYTGEFLRFVSSPKYDVEHTSDTSGYVIDIENSFRYFDRKPTHFTSLSSDEYLQGIIKTFISDRGCVDSRFEIIYD